MKEGMHIISRNSSNVRRRDCENSDTRRKGLNFSSKIFVFMTRRAPPKLYPPNRCCVVTKLYQKIRWSRHVGIICSDDFCFLLDADDAAMKFTNDGGSLESRTIFLQHDNNVTTYCLMWKEYDRIMDHQIHKKPLNSPDLNVNDLSFFRALHACEWDSVKEAREYVDVRQGAYCLFISRKLNLVFLTLQSCL